jgi:dihydrodipicolinate synthase/N-acetylneuraminate lyase
MLGLDEGLEGDGNLESALVIDPGRRIPSKNGVLLHFAPPETTRMLEKLSGLVNAKIPVLVGVAARTATLLFRLLSETRDAPAQGRMLA